MPVVLTNVHMDFVYEPANKLVTVVMVVVVELSLPCSNTRDKALVVYHASVPF